MNIKTLTDKVKSWHIILVFVVTFIGFVSPYVVKLDNRWAKAEDTFQSIQQVYTHSLKTSQRLDIKIAEDELNKVTKYKIEFEIKYGIDPTLWSAAEQQLYITILEQYEKAKLSYENAVKGQAE